jgi:hypothetical protein
MLKPKHKRVKPKSKVSTYAGPHRLGVPPINHLGAAVIEGMPQQSVNIQLPMSVLPVSGGLEELKQRQMATDQEAAAVRIKLADEGKISGTEAGGDPCLQPLRPGYSLPAGCKGQTYTDRFI